MQTVNPIANRLRREASEDPIAFWERAAEGLPWFRKWDEVFDWQPPSFRWFSGAKTNLAYNCIDHHVNRGWGGHAALVYANERGERQVFTYSQLKHEVERIAAALRGMGIEKGDRITIYMPISAEAIMLMLATVRIGAIHSVVFAGFGAGALGDRIQASGSRSSSPQTSPTAQDATSPSSTSLTPPWKSAANPSSTSSCSGGTRALP